MQEVQGKYTSAKIFAKTIEDGVIAQVENVTNHPIFKDCNIAIQADCHVGKGCVIGFTSQMPKNGEVIPNIIGVDQFCGMYTVKLSDNDITNDYAKLDKVIKRNIPTGRNGRYKFSPLVSDEFIEKTKKVCKDYLKEDFTSHIKRVGSLGDGNHFISLEKGKSGTYLIIHTGSRNIGLKLAIYFQDLAIKTNCYGEGELKQLSYLSSKDAEDYLLCADYCREYANLNRKIIAHDIMVGMRWKAEEEFETVHNYIGEDNIIRKGAISCKKDEKVLIPLNMKDGSLIATGKGNEDFNCSGPHGAGRLLSRSEAKSKLSMEEYKEQMKNIYSTCICAGTIDESPMAYKNGDEIIEQISPTAEIIDHLLPIYNFKATSRS